MPPYSRFVIANVMEPIEAALIAIAEDGEPWNWQIANAMSHDCGNKPHKDGGCVNTALNYLLPLAIAGLGIFNLIKDWDAHKHVARRVTVFIFVVIVATLSILSTYANNKRVTEERKAAGLRDKMNKEAIDHLSGDLAKANQKLDFVTNQNNSIISSLKSPQQSQTADVPASQPNEWNLRQGILAAQKRIHPVA